MRKKLVQQRLAEIKSLKKHEGSGKTMSLNVNMFVVDGDKGVIVECNITIRWLIVRFPNFHITETGCLPCDRAIYKSIPEMSLLAGCDC